MRAIRTALRKTATVVGLLVVTLSLSGFSPAMTQYYSMDWIELEDPFTGIPETRNVRLPTKRWVDLCSATGCQARTMVFLGGEIKDRVAGFFAHIQSPREERDAIAIAIAYLERKTCGRDGTCADRPDVSLLVSRFGQKDCTDEATNTTSFMLWMQLHGLLRWHRVGLPQSKGIHWTAMIRRDAKSFIVESDGNKTGQPPVIVCDKFCK